jgi:hypothetical protein
MSYDILETIAATGNILTKESYRVFDKIRTQVQLSESMFDSWPNLKAIFQKQLSITIDQYTTSNINLIGDVYSIRTNFSLILGQPYCKMRLFNDEIEKLEIIQQDFLIRIQKFIAEISNADISIISKIAIHQEIHSSMACFFNEKINLIRQIKNKILFSHNSPLTKW